MALIVPSWTGISYVFPVRLSVMVMVSLLTVASGRSIVAAGRLSVFVLMVASTRGKGTPAG